MYHVRASAIEAKAVQEKMPQQRDYRILVKTAPAGAFSLTKVLTSPRSCTPIDVKAACSSFEFVNESEELPEELSAFASFVLSDFFALAHRTGLYNRQRNLWDAIGRVGEIRFTRPRRGLFIKVNQPFVDLHCVDARGNTLIFGSLADREVNGGSAQGISRFVNNALKRAAHIQKRQRFLFGVFLALPDAIPENVQTMINRLTGADDPVARFESKLPPPLNVPLNVLRVEPKAAEDEPTKLTLSHPSFKGDESFKLVEAG